MFYILIVNSQSKNANLTYEQRKALIEERKEKQIAKQEILNTEENEEKRKKLSEVRTRNQIFN